jgi:hypothetical protein
MVINDMSKIEIINRIYEKSNNACLKGAFSLRDAHEQMEDIQALADFVSDVETTPVPVNDSSEWGEESQAQQQDNTEELSGTPVPGTKDKVAKRRA